MYFVEVNLALFILKENLIKNYSHNVTKFAFSREIFQAFNAKT